MATCTDSLLVLALVHDVTEQGRPACAGPVASGGLSLACHRCPGAGQGQFVCGAPLHSAHELAGPVGLV